MNWLRKQRPFSLYIALVVFFLLSRTVFFLITTAGEYRLYKSYGDDARRTSLDELYRTRNIEYPHLGVAFGAVVGYVADHLPSECRHLVRCRPNKFEWPYAENDPQVNNVEDQYEAALGLVLFTLDAWCLWLVFAIVRRVYPDEAPLTRVGRLFLYVIVTSPCALIVFDRQDLVVAWLALLAIWALAVDRPRLGYAFLVVGTAYKLVPALLLPVWVIAAATVKCRSQSTGVWLRTIVLEALISGVMLAAWPILTYHFGGGERGFLYLTWHSERGLQLEAPAAFPVLLFDSSVEFGSSFGSFNLVGDVPDRVAKVLGLAMPLSALAGMAIAARGFWRMRRPNSPAPFPQREEGDRAEPNPPAPFPQREGGDRAEPNPPAPFPQREGGDSAEPNPPAPFPQREGGERASPPGGVREGFTRLLPHVVASSLLIWVAFIAFNKVGSPQYLLWVAPLVPLLPLRTKAQRHWVLLLFVALLDNMLIFPCRYKDDLVGVILSDDPLRWFGPSTFGLFLLGVKSGTLVASTLWLAVLVWREPHVVQMDTLSSEPKP